MTNQNKKQNKIDCYVINLDRSINRWHRIKKRLSLEKMLKIQRVNAIDGQLLDANITQNVFATKSMLGCMLSHIKTWKKIASGNSYYGLVLEDDCQLSNSFGDKVMNLLNDLKENEVKWDFLYLGYFGPGEKCDSVSDNVISEFLKIYLQTLILPKVEIQKSNMIKTPYMPLGFHCYVITKSCAKKLVELFEKETTFWHVDAMFLKYHNKFNVYLSTTKLGWQETTTESSNMVEHDFPKMFNRIFDTITDKDNISISYYLTSPIGQINGVHINLWLLTYIILLLIIPFQYYFLLAFYILFEYILTIKHKMRLDQFNHGVMFGIFFILKSIKLNK